MQAEVGLTNGDDKEEVKFTGQLPPGVAPPSPETPGVIKEGEAPAWYENMFQAESSRELSSKEEGEEGYSLPSVPTWTKFENSKVGKSIDAKGLVKEKDDLMRGLGYEKGTEKDLAMDVAAVFNPGVDIAHATTKAAEGKYLDAGLYALFAAVPGAAAPLVKKAKELLGLGKKQAAKELLENTIKKNKNVIAKQMDVNVKTDVSVEQMNKNIDRYGQADPTLYGKPKSQLEFSKIVHESTEGIGAVGRSIDEAGITIKNLDPQKSVKNLGTSDSGQVIYEVTYPNGEKMKFWESTGSANKPVKLSPKNAHLNAKNSKGFFGVFPGNLDGSNVGHSKSWYIKSEGWERGYGSEIVEDTGIWLKSLKESGVIQ
tara:strand:- start:297 stop:1409 length:1113 start_codon:yes stop_codon:yes gene_type:complete